MALGNNDAGAAQSTRIENALRQETANEADKLLMERSAICAAMIAARRIKSIPPSVQYDNPIEVVDPHKGFFDLGDDTPIEGTPVELLATEKVPMRTIFTRPSRTTFADEYFLTGPNANIEQMIRLSEQVSDMAAQAFPYQLWAQRNPAGTGRGKRLIDGIQSMVACTRAGSGTPLLAASSDATYFGVSTAYNAFGAAPTLSADDAQYESPATMVHSPLLVDVSSNSRTWAGDADELVFLASLLQKRRAQLITHLFLTLSGVKGLRELLWDKRQLIITPSAQPGANDGMEHGLAVHGEFMYQGIRCVYDQTLPATTPISAGVNKTLYGYGVDMADEKSLRLIRSDSPKHPNHQNSGMFFNLTANFRQDERLSSRTMGVGLVGNLLVRPKSLVQFADLS